jgi:hypothetical protein
MRENGSIDDAISDFLRKEKDDKLRICPKCGTEMEKIGRTVSWCPSCRVNRTK